MLLGLTATPERADGLDIKHWFGGRIAAELRLWEALERGLLALFQYFGVHDGTDLSQIGWRRGQGYDIGQLSNVFSTTARQRRSGVGRRPERRSRQVCTAQVGQLSKECSDAAARLHRREQSGRSSTTEMLRVNG